MMVFFKCSFGLLLIDGDQEELCGEEPEVPMALGGEGARIGLQDQLQEDALPYLLVR